MPVIYPHLVKELNKNLKIAIPVVSGDTIALNNTCKSDENLKAFFFGKKKIKVIENVVEIEKEVDDNIFSSLDSLQSDIEKKYLMACTSREQFKGLEKLYEQVIECQNTLKEISEWAEDHFRTTHYSEVPKEILDTLSADPYIGAIGLDPKGRDNLVRFRNMSDCTFGIRESEGMPVSIFASKMRDFFKDNESLISENHNQWVTSLGAVDNKTWKEGVLEELEVLSQTTEYSEASNASQLQQILDKLTTKFKEVESVHNPEKLFRDSLARQQHFTGDSSKNTDACDYLGGIVGLDQGESLEYMDLMPYIRSFIQWDDLEVISEREKGVFEEVHESGYGFDGNSNAQTMYEERMSIAIQFLIGTANLVLKRKGKTDSNFGMVLEGVFIESEKKSLIGGSFLMIDSLLGKLSYTVSEEGITLVSQFSDVVMEWLNEKRVDLGIKEEITEEDVKEIKNLFTGNFRTIKGSPHFDEFLIRQEGGSIWKNIEGTISTDLRNVLKYGFKKEVGDVPEFEEGVRYFNSKSPLL